MPRRAEFRLRSKRRPTHDDEQMVVRAQAILAAHAEYKHEPLKPEDRKVLETIAHRARRAARQFPNYPVEVSPYVASLLRLED